MVMKKDLLVFLLITFELLCGGYLALRKSPAAVEISAIPAHRIMDSLPLISTSSPAPVDVRLWAERGRQLEPLPASEDGVKIEGAAQVDARGQLVMDIELRRLFDSFLAREGEEGRDAIRARIALRLQERLPPSAAQRAWDVLTRYLEYEDSLLTLSGHDGSYESILESLRRQRELRISLLGRELSEAFFHEDDEYTEFALQYVDNLHERDLTAEQKLAITDAMLEALPEQTRRLIEATGKPLREQQLGEEVADRIARRDQRRAEWRQRYDAYRRQAKAIARRNLAETDKEQQIDRLRTDLFAPSEQKRVAALDRTHP